MKRFNAKLGNYQINPNSLDIVDCFLGPSKRWEIDFVPNDNVTINKNEAIFHKMRLLQQNHYGSDFTVLHLNKSFGNHKIAFSFSVRNPKYTELDIVPNEVTAFGLANPNMANGYYNYERFAQMSHGSDIDGGTNLHFVEFSTNSHHDKAIINTPISSPQTFCILQDWNRTYMCSTREFLCIYHPADNMVNIFQNYETAGTVFFAKFTAKVFAFLTNISSIVISMNWAFISTTTLVEQSIYTITLSSNMYTIHKLHFPKQLKRAILYQRHHRIRARLSRPFHDVGCMPENRIRNNAPCYTYYNLIAKF